MDNRRLIDADKLLETLDVISQQARSIDMQELAKTIATEVRNGTFAPDPIPPTIKPGDLARSMTIRRFLNNLFNDIQEDGDTGVHLDMNLGTYLDDLSRLMEESGELEVSHD